MKNIDSILAMADEFAQITDEETFANEAEADAKRTAQLKYIYDSLKVNSAKRVKVEKELDSLNQGYHNLQNEWKRIQGNNPFSIEEILGLKS